MSRFVIRKSLAVVVGLLAVTASFSCFAQQSTGDAAAAPVDGPPGIEFALKRYIAVFNSHDADALAALWTENAVHVDKETGERTEGRAALAEDFRALFAESPEIMLAGEVTGVRMIGDGAAMVDGTATTVTADGDPSTSSFSAIFVKTNGKWLLDSVHETDVPAPVTPRQALEPLAWLVGHWRDASDADQVETFVRWSANQAFLIRSFVITREGEEPFEGTQVIGWDPRSGNIRSWTFNADGSFGEGVWSKVGDEWHVLTAQTLADGAAATATQVIRRVDDNTTTVQTIGKEVDGQPVPASDPITVTRVMEEPAEGDAAPAATDGQPAAVGGASGEGAR